MPKVSEEHKEQRRAAILEGARTCFARHGYEGATVARLEQETGLSRGAIFNYFENKEALFVALAVESSERLGRIWLEQGFRALLEAVAQEDPEWLSVQLEASAACGPTPSSGASSSSTTPLRARGSQSGSSGSVRRASATICRSNQSRSSSASWQTVSPCA